MTEYMPRWFTHPQTVTHPSTNPAVHGRESNSQPVDHESDALTTTPPSHPVVSCNKQSTFNVMYADSTQINGIKIRLLSNDTNLYTSGMDRGLAHLTSLKACVVLPCLVTLLTATSNGRWKRMGG